MRHSVEKSLNKLLHYCNSQAWIGYDPFDGLNSQIFQAIPFLKKYRLFRLAFLQLNKRSFINFRPLLMVKKGRNPKGVGLFLSSALNLYRHSRSNEHFSLIRQFIEWLKQDISPDYEGFSWGYNFDWQSRAFFLPKYTPTVVNTSFIGRAFIDAFEVLGEQEYLQIARSACDFILNNLNRLEDHARICFSYSPLDKYFVHNATALASALLARTYEKTGEEILAEMGKKSIQYVMDHQHEDGSWSYGEDKTARKVGIDSFHNGFILESMKLYTEATGDSDYVEKIKTGLCFYQNNFFLNDGSPKYFSNQIFPLDIHSASQGIVTLTALEDYGADRELCDKIVNWMIHNLQDKDGFFYYQKRRDITNKIPYIRWGQAWALHALSTYLASDEE